MPSHRGWLFTRESEEFSKFKSTIFCLSYGHSPTDGELVEAGHYDGSLLLLISSSLAAISKFALYYAPCIATEPPRWHELKTNVYGPKRLVKQNARLQLKLAGAKVELKFHRRFRV